MKKTVGQQITEHNAKGIQLEDDISEYTNAMSSKIVTLLEETAQDASQHELYIGKDFYLVLVKNIDRLLGQPRFQCWARRSCPTPVYKQDVFKYHHTSGHIEFLWCIPAQDRYWHIVHNPQLYFEKKETARLAQFVILMESGKLLEWVKKENKEEDVIQAAVIKMDKTKNSIV